MNQYWMNMPASLRNAAWICVNYVLLQPVHTSAGSKAGGYLSDMEALLTSANRSVPHQEHSQSSIGKGPIKPYVT